jgi:recombination-promoting nuclease RpnA
MLYIYIVLMSANHDETIRAVLEEKEAEIDLLELCFPEELCNLWDLDSVRLEKDTFVDDESRANRFDLFLSVNDKENQKRYIHFLFENKSYPDDFVILDFHRYIALAYKKILQAGGLKPGPILPILFLQTSRPWDPPDVEKLLEFNESERERYHEYLPHMKIETLNLHGGLVQELDFRKFLHFMIFIMHHIRSDELEEKLEYALRNGGRGLFQESSNGVDRKRILFLYLLRSLLQSRRKQMAEVIEKNLSGEDSEEFLTIAEWERREGKLEGKLETAQRMHESGEPRDKILQFTGLSLEDLQAHGIY